MAHAAGASGTCPHRRRSHPAASASSSSQLQLAGLLLISIIAFSSMGVGAQSLSKYRTAPTATLRICVIDSAPALSVRSGMNVSDSTVMSSSDANTKLRGLCMDMINTIFTQILGWPFTVTYYDGSATGFSNVAYKIRMGIDCDVGVQSFFISASRDICTTASCPTPPAGTVFSSDSDFEPYACCLDFSYPFFTGGWSFMSQVSTGSNINYINVFFQRDIVQAMCVCVICLFFMAHLIWLIERTQYGKSVLLTHPKEGFSKYYLDGLKDGVWFSSTTLMNGVVNSEKTIITPVGRLITTTWVLFGILMSAFVTAVIAASLTTAQLTTSAIMTQADVAGKVVCLSEGFFDAFFDASFPGIGVQKVVLSDVRKCFPMVSAGTVDAAFSIREEALGYFASGLGSGLIIAPIVKSQGYGMVWTQAWPYQDWVNEALLLWQQNVVATQPPYTDSIQKWYFGDANQITYGGNVDVASQKWNWGLIGAAVGLIGTYMALQVFVISAHWIMKRQALKAQRDKSTAGASTKSKAESSTSFFLRAASMIAAPPGTLTLEPDDEDADDGGGGGTSTKRAPSYMASVRSVGSSKVAPGHQGEPSAFSPRAGAGPRPSPLHGTAADGAAFAAIMNKLESLQQQLDEMRHEAPRASARAAAAAAAGELPVTMTVGAKSDKAWMMHKEPPKLQPSGDDITSVENFGEPL